MDRITNPKDSNVCRTMGNKDNTTPTGSDIPDLCFCYKHSIPSELADVPESCLCYKHVIPSEFNFDNPKFHFTDIITNPKDSNVCKTTGNNDNTTPTGSYYPDSCFCYKYAIPSELADISLQNLCFKHLIPSEFNFDNPKFHFTDIITNPKDSNVCKTTGNNDNTTPTGSYYPDSCFCYKYAIPSELADISLQNLCFKHLIPSEFNFDNPKFHFTDIITNPKDSNVCRTTGNTDKITNPKDSNVYKTMGNKDNSTPSGSNILGLNLCYKHAIPSELANVPESCLCYKHVIPSEFNFDNPKFHFTDIITNPKDSNVCRTTGNKNNPTPSGSNISGSCFCYKHVIPLELADVPASCFCYKHEIPSELLDITVQNIYFKHVIHSEFNIVNPKFYFTDKTTNPKDSNVCRTMGNKNNSTPTGSNIPSELVDISLPNLHSKHAIPMGLLNNKHKSKC